MYQVQLDFIIIDLPSRLATTDSKPVPAPISSTALSIRFISCWLFSKNWHKAIAYKSSSHDHICHSRVIICTDTCGVRAYPGPDQSAISIQRLANTDVMTSKVKRFLSQCVVNAGLPDVPPVQSLSCHHFLACAQRVRSVFCRLKE